MIRAHHLSVALILSIALVACDKASDADQKATSAQREADEKIASAGKEASDKSKSAQAEADKKIAEAQADFEKMRETYRHNKTTDLADLDKKIAKLEAKAKDATGSARTDLEASLKDIRARRDAFVTHSKALDQASAKTWDDTKTSIEKEWKELAAQVDKA